jgi:hypothetical protein
LSYPGRSDDQVQRMNWLLTDGGMVEDIRIYTLIQWRES